MRQRKKNIFLFKKNVGGKRSFFSQSCRWLLLPTLDLTASTFPGRSTRRGRGRGSNSILGATCIHFPAQREREKLVVFLLSCFVCKKYFFAHVSEGESLYTTEMQKVSFFTFLLFMLQSYPQQLLPIPPKKQIKNYKFIQVQHLRSRHRPHHCDLRPCRSH